MKTTTIHLSKTLRLLGLFLLAIFALRRLPFRSAYAATIVVDTVADELDGSPGNNSCSLREAISNANNDNNNQADCLAGSGADIITFDSSLNGLTISLTRLGSDNSNTVGDLDIRDDLTIMGNGVTNTVIDGLTLSDRVFHIPVTAITVEFHDLTVQNGNVSSFGGGIYNDGGTVTVAGSLIDSNTADLDGGGIASAGSGMMLISGSTVSNNTAVADGGGISNNSNSSMTITDSTIQGNRVTGVSGSDGGGIRNNNSVMSVNNSLINNNTANDDGGGIFSVGTGVITITNSTISNNLAPNVGGGVYNSGTATINSSTINDNKVTGASLNNGGGVFNLVGTVNINNSTLSGNSAFGGSAESSGGAFFNDGVAHIYNSTISNNWVSGSAPILEAGGITNDGAATLTVDNSILTNNTNGDCTNGTGASLTGSNNLIDDYMSAPCSAISTASVTNFDTTLADNGGPTRTHALLGGSNAIDAGINDCPDSTSPMLASDQRGVTRPLDGNADMTATCDIGAYEAGELQCNIQADVEPTTYLFFGNVSIEIENDGSNLDCLRVTHIDRDHPYATLGIQTGQYWVIEAWQSDQSSAATNDYVANLTLPHTVIPDSNASVCRWTTYWNCARTSSTMTTVTWNGVPGFSDWAVGDNVGPTAVTLQNLFVTTPTISIALLLCLLLAGLMSWQFLRKSKL